jgi:DNA-binding transcriptional MocR family regulator
MSGNAPDNEIRNMNKGDWYWIPKAVIQEYASRIGAMGIAVYNFLASMADRNQSCFPSQRYMAERLGYSRSTMSRAIKCLEEHRLIRKEMRSRYHCVYQLLRVRCGVGETQMSTAGNSDVIQEDTNKTKLTRINNNVVVSVSQKKLPTERRPLTREELLALDISEVLDDQRNIKQYLHFARKFPESILREFLSQVKQTPPEKIKKSRAALFVYLVKQYDQQTA